MKDTKLYVTLAELMDNPELLQAPKSLVARLVWPKRVTMLAAREKAGKSTLAGAAAAALSAGTPFLGEETPSGNVLIVALEEHPQELVQRLIRFGANPTKVAFIQRGAENLLAQIHAAAKEFKPDLIIVDTLVEFANEISSAPLEPNDSQGWANVMGELTALAREFCAVLLLHHSNKNDGKYRDSTAIGAAVDVIIEMYGEGGEPRTLKARGRFPLSDTRLRLEPDGFHLLETAEEVEARILRFIASHPRCSLRDLREGVGGRAGDVGKIKDKLLKAGKILNVGTSSEHSYMASGSGSHPMRENREPVEKRGSKDGGSLGRNHYDPQKTQWEQGS